jgi:hypothetical protein
VIDRSLLYLATRQSIGGMKYRLSRLKNPRYLLPAVLAIFYFWMTFGFAGLREHKTPPQDIAPMLRLFVGPGVGLLFAMMWTFAPGRPAPAFNRAEAHQLFMLPVTRRSLVVYRLLRPQLSFLFIAGFAALGASRSADVNPAFAAGGAWLMVNLLALNAMAASLACNRMKRVGVPTVLQAWPGVLIAAWVLLPLILNWRPLDIGHEPPIPWLRERMSGGLSATLHWPLRQLGNIVGATDIGMFGIGVLSAAVAAVLLFALCMLLVAPFEEEALKIAEAGGRKLDAMRRGGGAAAMRLSRMKKVRSTKLRLKPTGPRWRAIFWQTLVAEWRVGNWKLFTTIAGLMLAFGLFAKNLGKTGAIATMVLMLSISFSSMTVLMAPRMMVTGLHTELRFLPVLKGLPIRGVDLLRGKVRAGALLVCAPVFTLLAAMGQSAYQISGELVSEKGPDLLPLMGGGVACAFVLVPAVAMTMIALESSAVLMFPAWMTSMQSEPGFETIGRNMLSLLVRMVVGSIMLLPAGLIGGIGGGVGYMLGGVQLALIIGGLLGALALVGEVELLVILTGKRFDAMDASPESA